MAKVFESVVSRAQTPFINEAVVDFTKEEIRRAQAEALAQVRSEFGRTYPLVIGGKKIANEDTFASLNPSQPEQVVGYFARATVEQANEAVQAANTTFATWKRVPAEERAGYLFKAADLLRQRRFIMNAWMIYEVGKSWIEADADTAEAIDFLEFYAREMIRLADEQPMTRIPGEENKLVYIPSGCRRGYSTLELSVRHYDWYDQCGICGGQYRHSQTGKYGGSHCRRIYAHSGSGRIACRRRQFSARIGCGRRRCAGG